MIGRRLREYRKSKELTVAEFAKIIGVSQGTLSDIENEKTWPSAETLVAVVRHTDISPVWLVVGSGAMIKGPEEKARPQVEPVFKRLMSALNTDNYEDLSVDIGIEAATLSGYCLLYNEMPYSHIISLCNKHKLNIDWVFTGKGDMHRGAESSKPSSALLKIPSEFVLIPQVRGEIGAGGGLLPDNEVEMQIAFRKDWIKRKGDPRNMSLIRVRGDSMEPTLYSGDAVLVDHSRNFIDPEGGIYAISLGGIIMIKRLQSLYPAKKKVLIISDNKTKYEPIESDPEKININGKVLWFGREIER